MKNIDIEWYPLISVTTDEDSWEYRIDNIPEPCRSRSSFYCIYGRHPVYGADSLLYIGETKSVNGAKRDINQRFKEHLSGRFWSHTELSVSIGVPKKDVENDVLQALESILIAAHMPALNRKHIDGSNELSKNCLIRNYGFSRSLMPECSGAYWCK